MKEQGSESPMSEQLGKIEKPSVEEFRAGRKLYFIPLIFSPSEAPAELEERINKYWEQVEAHLTNLEAKLGNANKIYHELVPVGGEDGVKAVERLNKGSYQITRARLDRGVELQVMEDAELLAEFMDWSRCLSLNLQSPKVFTQIYESYATAQKKRNEHIAKQIDETLKDVEAGILFMREGHQVQFSADIQVFYVAPPALDELKRWARERETRASTEEEQKPTD